MFSILVILNIFNTGFCLVPISPIPEPAPHLQNLLKKRTFVDKTNIIRVLFESPPVVMASAPLRFGKSVNMDIIKSFCEPTVDRNGNRVQREQTNNYKLFKNHKLNVYKDREFFYKHFGNYPVIYIDLKIISCITYNSFMRSVKRIIMGMFEKHKYLLKTKADFINEYCNDKNLRKLSEPKLINSTLLLSSLLYEHFNKTKCIVLIDGYDHLVRKAVFHSGTILNKSLNFLFDFLNFTLNSNPYVFRSLTTTNIMLIPVSPDKKDYITSMPFLTNHSLSLSYGFTEDEVKLLLKRHNKTDKLSEVKKWYNGYKLRHNRTKIYNPLSIVGYLKSGSPSNYWIKSCDMRKYKEVFLRKKIQNKIKNILESHSLKLNNYIDKLNVTSLMQMKKIIRNDKKNELTDNDGELFIQLMVDLGYFHIIFPEGKKSVRVAIPNREIKEEVNEFVFVKNIMSQL